MLKEARKQSSGSWNHQRHMIEGSGAFWENLTISWPRIKKFNNSKASFPLFDDLGELYDGQLAEGTFNVTSLESPQHKETHHQILDLEDGAQAQDFDDIMMQEIPDEDDELDGRDVLLQDAESSAAAAQRSGQQKTTAAPKRKDEKEEKDRRRAQELKQ